MKPKLRVFIYVPCLVFGLFTSSCSDKKSGDEVTSGSEVAVEEQGEVGSANLELGKQEEVVPVSEADLTDVAGFAGHLPKDTELFVNAQGIGKLIGLVRDSAIGEFAAKMAKGEGEDIDESLDSDEYKEMMKVAGEEAFFSMGDGSAEVMRATGDMYSVYYKMYYKLIGKIMLNAMEGENAMGSQEMMMGILAGMMTPVMDEILEMDDYKMPRVYMGFKVSSESERARYTKLIQDTLAMANGLNEMVPGMEIPFEEDAIDSYGGFKGMKINYGKWLGTMSDLGSPQLEMMGMDAEYMEKFTEKFKDFKVTLLAGSYGDYVVIYLGDTSEGLKFIEDPSDSLLANEEVGFLKEYHDKDVVSVSYVSEEISLELSKVSTIMEDFSAGVNELLSETSVLGDTTDIQGLLGKLGANGRGIRSLSSPSRFGSVAYLEDGFKMDSFHGGGSGMYDLESKRRLADIAMAEDAVVSSSWVSDGAHTDLVIQSLEDFVHLAYEVAKLTVEHDVDNADFQDFSDTFKMLDAQFSDDLLNLWRGVRDGAKLGLGNEGALVIDLKGVMPRVPDVPTVLLENGKVPRLAMGYDVLDQGALASGWEEIDTTSQEIVGKIERLTNEKINYRTPELAERDGIDFWSYQLGITTFDANLAIGLNDQLMFLTSSPAFVESFVEEYNEEGKSGGMDFKFRLDPIRVGVKDWMKLFDERGDDITDTFDRDEFEEAQVIIKDILKVSEELDSMDFSMRKMNGEVRSFFHLNKRN